MSHADKALLYHTMNLFSQYYAELKPEGETFRHTCAVAPDEAEMIGYLFATANLVEKQNPEITRELKEEIIPFIETIGIAKWERNELTHLGGRVGQRHKKGGSLKDAKLPSMMDGMNEADLFVKEGEEESNTH